MATLTKRTTFKRAFHVRKCLFDMFSYYLQMSKCYSNGQQYKTLRYYGNCVLFQCMVDLENL